LEISNITMHISKAYSLHDRRFFYKASNKKPGGQKGHDGHKLYCSSVPDEIIDEVPKYCTRCEESLSDAERVLDYVMHVISIPELKLVIKEMRHYVMVCKNSVNVFGQHRDGDQKTWYMIQALRP